MKSAPIRLTKFESGVLLGYVNNKIADLESQIMTACEDNLSEEYIQSLSIDTAMYRGLKVKIQNCYDKCTYSMPYQRKKEN